MLLATVTGAHALLYEAGLLHAIRDAVVAVLVIVFAVGAVLGFLVARLIYRRSR